MSVPAPPPVQPQQSAPTPGVQPWSGPTPAQRSGVVDTPRLLNRWQLTGTAIVLAFGLLSALLQFLTWAADGRAADDTEQLMRVQAIQSDLLRADALATNAFLAGGLEPTERRAEYDDAIESTLAGITAAAQAQPADRQALEALNIAVSEYVATVAQARSNNRQGLPIGAEYLATASADLRERVLPIVQALVDANTDRAERSMRGQHPIWLFLAGIVAMVGLWWVNRQLARTFRRHVNLGVATAAGIVVLVTLITVSLAVAGAVSNTNLRDGEFRTAIDQAAARTAANDAKANESLRLVKRGSGAAFEVAWQESSSVVEENSATDELRDLWKVYVTAHDEIVAADDRGAWETAVALATSDAPEGATAALDAYDAASRDLVADAAEEVTSSLRGGRWFAFLLALLTLGAGVGAAVAIARGIAERRREFA